VRHIPLRDEIQAAARSKRIFGSRFLAFHRRFRGGGSPQVRGEIGRFDRRVLEAMALIADELVLDFHSE